MRTVTVLALALALAAPSAQADVTEPKSGTAFAEKQGDMSLLGTGLRTKTMLKVKVYAIGLYAADSALPALKGKSGDGAEPNRTGSPLIQSPSTWRLRITVALSEGPRTTTTMSPRPRRSGLTPNTVTNEPR